MIGEAERNILDAYRSVFDCADGELVLEDLSRAFLRRLNADLDEEVSEIPHPFRSYHIDGQRFVVAKIHSIVALAKLPEEEDYE